VRDAVRGRKLAGAKAEADATTAARRTVLIIVE
jgi:hypothetical protein